MCQVLQVGEQVVLYNAARLSHSHHPDEDSHAIFGDEMIEVRAGDIRE